MEKNNSPEKDEDREPDQMFLIGRDELLCIKMLVEDDGDHNAEILQIISNACSRPHNPVPSSTELIAMANLEWKNREERRGIHNREDWCCGWMAGFLSEDKPDWVKAQVQAAREDEEGNAVCPAGE